MPTETKPRSKSVELVGLRCPKCWHRKMRSLYTRSKKNGNVTRVRECRQCFSRVMCVETVVGVLKHDRHA